MSGKAPKPARQQRRAPDALSRRVGSRIRTLRKELDWNFYAFVGETELAQGVVSEIERGLVLPRLTTLARIASTMEITVADLVLGDTLREQVFAATRGLTDADLRALLEHVERMRPVKTK